MERLYKVTSSTTTLFVHDDSIGSSQAAGEDAIVREQEHHNPIVKVEEVKTLMDLPEGWSGNELVWGVDEEMSAKSWLRDRDEKIHRDKEIDVLKSELECLRSQLLKLGVELGYELNQIEGSNV